MFIFSGVISESSKHENGPTIMNVNFYEWAGRPGHEGASAISLDNPVAGSSLTLVTSLFGDITTASYSMRNEAGELLQTNILSKGWETLPTYACNILIPSANFTVEIVATGADGKTNRWLSKIYKPQNLSAKLVVDSAVISFGQIIPAKIVGTSTIAAGDYTISLLRPAEFPGELGPWTVAISPAGTFEIPIQIQAPASGESGSYYTLTVSYAPKGLPQNAQYSIQRFFAR